MAKNLPGSIQSRFNVQIPTLDVSLDSAKDAIIGTPADMQNTLMNYVKVPQLEVRDIRDNLANEACRLETLRDIIGLAQDLNDLKNIATSYGSGLRGAILNKLKNKALNKFASLGGVVGIAGQALLSFDSLTNLASPPDIRSILNRIARLQCESDAEGIVKSFLSENC